MVYNGIDIYKGVEYLEIRGPTQAGADKNEIYQNVMSFTDKIKNQWNDNELVQREPG